MIWFRAAPTGDAPAETFQTSADERRIGANDSSEDNPVRPYERSPAVAAGRGSRCALCNFRPAIGAAGTLVRTATETRSAVVAGLQEAFRGRWRLVSDS